MICYDLIVFFTKSILALVKILSQVFKGKVKVEIQCSLKVLTSLNNMVQV